MSNLTEDQQQLLQKMIRENNTENTTQKIREAKHSGKIRKDISIMNNVKRKLKTKNVKKLENECQAQCNFLFLHYPIIYNKMLRDQIDLKIMYQFLDVLESIEVGKRDQHEASYEIGMLLKRLYVDKKLDLNKEKKREEKNIKSKKISYEEFKKLQEQEKMKEEDKS